jgi:hypothetical protein
MATYRSRLRAFLRGDQFAAEDLGTFEEVGPVAWIAGAEDNEVAKYAVEVSQKAAEQANAALSSLQTKASALLTLLLAITPLAVAVSGLALSSTAGPPWARLAAFGLFVIVVILFISSGIIAFLASGLLIVGGVNPARLSNGPTTEKELRIAEADAWYYAAVLAMQKGPRIAQDLFQARRRLVIGLIVALIASPFFVIARTGTQVVTGEAPGATVSQTPSPTTTPTPASPRLPLRSTSVSPGT